MTYAPIRLCRAIASATVDADPTGNAALLRPPMVWREDRRIRRADGVGYGDVVPDEDIWAHLAGHVEKRDAEMAAFCASVLLMRTIEREA